MEQLQLVLPRAKVIYSSATGASEPTNLVRPPLLLPERTSSGPRHCIIGLFAWQPINL